MSSTVTRRPVADGSVTDLVPSTGSDHYALVSDDSDSTYLLNVVQNVWDTDLFTTTALDIPAICQINSVTVRVRTSGNGYGSFKASLKINGTQYDSSGSTPGGVGNTDKTWSTNPDTGNAWITSDIDAMEFGVSLYGPGDVRTKCYEIWLIVDWDLLPDSGTLYMRPSADGTENALTLVGGGTHWESQKDDSDSTYLTEYGSGTYKRDLFDKLDLPLPTDAIITSVKVELRLGKAGGSPTAKSSMRIDGVTYDSAAVTISSSTPYDIEMDGLIWTTHPDTGAKLTVSDINGMEFGVVMKDGGDYIYRGYCYESWLVVAWEQNPNGGGGPIMW